MKFYVPHAKRGHGADRREEIAKVIHDQLKIAMTPRRIQSIEYTHDKKKYRLEVGKPENQEHRYEVVAIFESKPFIVATRAKSGENGPTILVNADEITKIVDFD